MQLEMRIEIAAEEPFLGSVLTLTERAVCRNMPAVDAFLATVPGAASYRSVIDALAATLEPRLAGAIAAFYAGRGRPLVDLWREDAIARLDRRFAKLVLGLAAIVVALADYRPSARWHILRSGFHAAAR